MSLRNLKHSLKSYDANLNWRLILSDWIYLTLGSMSFIVAVAVFLAPANLSPGSVSGIAIVVTEFTGWPIGMLMLLLNIPMLIIGFYFLGRFRFLISTMYVVLLTSVGIDVVALWLPPEGVTDDLLLNTLYSAILGGLGAGLVFRGRGTVAGTSVLGRVIQLKTGMPISQVYLMTDGLIIVAAGVTFGWEIALYSLVTLFVWGIAVDYVLEGPSVVRTVFIITERPDEISEAIIQRLGVGVTAWSSRGMYSKIDKTTLFCTVYRPDIDILREIVSQVDVYAFIVIGQGHQARGGVLRQKVGVAPKPKLSSEGQSTSQA